MNRWIDGAFSIGFVAFVAGMAMLSVPWSLIVGGGMCMAIAAISHVVARRGQQ